MWLDVTYKGDAVSTNFLCEQKSARDLWTTKQHFCFCIYMHSQVSAIHKKWKTMTRVANALQTTLWPSITQCHDLSCSICQEWSIVSQNHSQCRCLCRQSHNVGHNSGTKSQKIVRKVGNETSLLNQAKIGLNLVQSLCQSYHVTR